MNSLPCRPALAVAVFLCQVILSMGEVSLDRRTVVNVPTEALRSLSHGMTEHEVEAALGARGVHQATALISNDIIRVTAYFRSEIYGMYYLVFVNQILTKVCEPPPFEMGVRRFGDHPPSAVRLLADPETRLAEVLAAEDMIGPELAAALQPAERRKRRGDPGLSAALFLTRLIFRDRTAEAQEERDYKAILDRFDPFKVMVGSHVDTIESRLGSPHIQNIHEDGRDFRYYGHLSFRGTRELQWLCIVYSNGTASRVFSSQFIDWNIIRTLEHN